mmetsp:Transcript_99459/g.306692  ORF Transcript_99459/g.306692 Transcript_99459/m.306692 type:complete len:435 (+) Transcript_99459:51-1355(+)
MEPLHTRTLPPALESRPLREGCKPASPSPAWHRPRQALGSRACLEPSPAADRPRPAGREAPPAPGPLPGPLSRSSRSAQQHLRQELRDGDHLRLGMAPQQARGARDRVRRDVAAPRAQALQRGQQAAQRALVVGGHGVGHQDGDPEALAGPREGAHEPGRAEERAAGVREVVDDEDVVVRPQVHQLLLGRARGGPEEELLPLLHPRPRAPLVGPEDVLLRQPQLPHGAGEVALVGALVGEEHEGAARAQVPAPRRGLPQQPGQQVGHQALGADAHPQVGRRAAHGRLLVELQEEQLQGRPPEGLEGLAVERQGGRWAREGRPRRREQPDQRLRRGHVQPLARGLGVAPGRRRPSLRRRSPAAVPVLATVPAAGALHLAGTVPGQHHDDLRGPAPGVAARGGVGLPLGPAVLPVRDREALKGLEQRELLKQAALV